MSLEHSPMKAEKYTAPQASVVERVAILGDLTELSTEEGVRWLGQPDPNDSQIELEELDPEIN